MHASDTVVVGIRLLAFGQVETQNTKKSCSKLQNYLCQSLKTAFSNTFLSLRLAMRHSVRCMDAVIVKFANIEVGILKKFKVLGVRCQKVCPYGKLYLNY